METLSSISELTQLLSELDFKALLELIRSGELEPTIPGMSRIINCDQGSKIHLEGSVDIHTAMVVSKFKEIRPVDPLAVFDGIDLLAALIHDLEKPSTRVDDGQGGVTFPGHEARVAVRVPELSKRLGLSDAQAKKLHFLVAEHGLAHSLPRLNDGDRARLCAEPFWRNLRLLQRADAQSCYLDLAGTKFLPVHWEHFENFK